MNSFKKYKNKGLSGLTNLGNTCFINSVLQVLSHTYEFNLFLDNKKYIKKLNNNKYDSVLLIEWDNLHEELWKENTVVTPNKFVNVIHKLSKIKRIETFSGFSQNDLPEFLIFIIDCFHNALSREVSMNIEGNVINEKDKIARKCYEKIKQIYEKDYSEIWKLFYGINISVLTKLNGEQISISPEPFFIINLPIPLNTHLPTLENCFDIYTEEETIGGDNCLKIDGTNEKIPVKKQIQFWNFPDILVIDLKRFDSMNKKNQIMVDFPLKNLNLSKYVVGYNAESYIYDLYGVCNHSGSSFGGHYTSFVKNANDKWYYYNDTNVVEVLVEEQIKTPNAYCFFYRKQTS